MSRTLVAAPPKSKSDASRSPTPPLRSKTTSHVPPVTALHGGSPLPPSLRDRMEASFGERFDAVRVHTDGRAASLAGQHSAEAVTVNHHIAFGTGRYRPGTASGDHLVAHELAHVAQQRHGGGHAIQTRSLVSQPDEPAERAAESAADTAVQGGRVMSLGPSYTTRNRIMRRAINRLKPPPNPAPVRSPGGPAPTGVSSPSPDPVVANQPRSEIQETFPQQELASRSPVGQAATEQEQTDAAREQAKEVVAEKAAEELETEEPSRGSVELLQEGGTGAEAAEEVKEAPAEEAADKKDEAEAGKESDQAAEEAAAEEAGAEPEPEPQAPQKPEDDPGFRRVAARTRKVGAQQAHNNAAQRKAAEAIASAPAPGNEVEAAAAGVHVGKMAEQEPAPFDKGAFKAALVAKINQIAPNTLKDADKFKSRGRSGELKTAVVGEVEASKEGAAGPIRDTTEETPDTSTVTPKTVEPMPPTEPGAPPPGVGAAAAAPKPKPDSQVSLDAGVEDINSRMEAANVTEETLLNSNEPDMIGAVEAKREHQQHAAEAPERYRQDEAKLVTSARGQAESEATAGTDSMYSTRGQQFAAVLGDQTNTVSQENAKETELANKLQSIFETAQSDVRKTLETLDTDVNTIFDSGAQTARTNFDNYVESEKEAYKRRRYSGAVGKARWVRDLFLPLPDEVNYIYQQARSRYIQEMDGVIDRVANTVETGLNSAAARITKGRTDVETEIETARQNGVTLSDGAISDIQSRFDTLESEVKNFEQKTIDSLAQRYVENLKAVDARIEEMKQEDRGLLGRAADAIAAAIETIEELRKLLLGVLAKAASVIETIISDPIGFLSNLIAGVKAGLGAFVANIGAHLKKGLMGWLFGAVAAAGITLPESFDLKGILGLAAQVLGLTYANIRARAVRIVGEPIVKGIETTVDFFRTLMTQGIAGVWNMIKDMLGNLAETVLGAIRTWVIEKVVMAGIAWILSLLNPASALVRAVKAIIDIVMFFVNRGSQILALVNAVLDSIAAIASGAIGAMSSAIEGALARALPVAISFLASLLGLGGISGVIRDAIEKIQAPINRAIDWLINKAVKLAKRVGGLFGFGKKKDETQDTNDPEHDAKLTAGLAAIDQEELKYLEDGTISRENAAKVANTVRGQHRIFKSITVVPGESGTWDYRYEASSGIKPGEKRDTDLGIMYVSARGSKPPGPSQVGALPASDAVLERSREPGAAATFEREQGQQLESQTGIPLERSSLPDDPTIPRLVHEPLLDPSGPGAGSPRRFKPDFVLFGPKQIEVFEVTLDAEFRLPAEKDVAKGKGASSKEYQIESNIVGLARRYPGHPIVFNLVTTRDAPPHVRTQIRARVNGALRTIAQEGHGNKVTFIWRG